jgi:hypothetical protein
MANAKFQTPAPPQSTNARAIQRIDEAEKTDWSGIEKTLGEMTSAGSVEVHEDGQWLAELAGLHCELRPEGKQAIVHLWSDERNLARRVVHVALHAPEHVIFDVQKFGRERPGRLEFIRTEAPRRSGRVNVEKSRARLGRVLAENFPDAQIDSLSASPDLEHSFSGLYVRGVMSEGRRAWAILAAPIAATATAIDGILTFGLVWLDWTRDRAGREAIEGLRLFLPEGATREVRHRIQALNSSARVEIFELIEHGTRVRAVDLADTGNIESWLTPRREIEGVLDAARDAIESICAADPQAAEYIAADVRPAGRPGTRRGSHEVALRYRGLEFARWTDGQLTLGVGDARNIWTPGALGSLKKLLHDLELHRNPLASSSQHRLYRAAPERWLETLVRRDPAQLDAQLDPGFLYSQVSALSANDRGLIDLLGLTRQRRLVVIEMKASEDIHLPLQAADYWLRMRRHLSDGDFPRYGYFTGIEIDPRPPLLWLVAPALRFHPANEIVLKYFSPEIQVTRVGVAENWRRGPRVVFRKYFNSEKREGKQLWLPMAASRGVS